MNAIVSSPNITDIDRLYEIYQSTPYFDSSTKSMDQFYTFLSTNSNQRQLFLEEYCDYNFVSLDGIVILKLSIKE